MSRIHLFKFITYVMLLFAVGCGGGEGSIEPENDDSFNIVAHTDAGFTDTNRKVVVFGIPIYAFAEVEDAKLLHAANIMAEYLDNDEDGSVDNPALLEAMLSNGAALFLWKTEAQAETEIDAQDLGADESRPDWHNNHDGDFDAALEEIWHVITASGYANAYPTIFGEDINTSLTDAMDIARGGQFIEIPVSYDDKAWYTYDDETCDYNCMATEYIYWAMTSILGAQENRWSEIQQEWDLNTREEVQNTDSTIYNLLTDDQYGFPTKLPDGTYDPI